MIYATSDLEKSYWDQGLEFVCGVDEVGRGCFAGPVVVGAVIFPKNGNIPVGIADSKLLTPKKREQLAEMIKKYAQFWAVEEVGVEVINKVGIGKATQIAFYNVVKKLKPFPDFILIDAFQIKNIDPQKQRALIGGDRISVSIAAASIIAKVYRDSLMSKLDIKYAHYGFEKHKGYGTKFHRDMIKLHGLCDLHRTSFDLAKFLN